MRKAFTLIELMIVIAIIAIIAAIAIPNLLESRITANESQASASLKSGIFPGQVQFQNGAYIDVDSDGRGIYAAHPAWMAGIVGTGATMAQAPNKPLSLLDATFNNAAGQAHGIAGATGAQVPAAIGAVALNTNSTRKASYDYACVISATEDSAETYFVAVACPRDTTGNEGRRGFGIGIGGTIYQVRQTVDQTNTTVANMVRDNGGALIMASYAVDVGTGAVTTTQVLPLAVQATVADTSTVYQK